MKSDQKRCRAPHLAGALARPGQVGNAADSFPSADLSVPCSLLVIPRRKAVGAGTKKAFVEFRLC